MISRFEIIKPDIDESRRAAEGLVDYAERLSREKAEAAAQLVGRRAGADHRGRYDCAGWRRACWASRPTRRTRGECCGGCGGARMRSSPPSRSHDLNCAGDRAAESSPATHAPWSICANYSVAEIDDLCSHRAIPWTKPAPTAIQNETFRPVARIEGSYSNVVGLPLEANLRAALAPARYYCLVLVKRLLQSRIRRRPSIGRMVVFKRKRLRS